MKKILLIMLGILLITIIPIVISSNEYGKITSGKDLLIIDVDVKVDGLTSRNLDYGEEISRVAHPDSEVIFEIEVLNNNSGTDMTDVEMVIEIEDLDLEEATAEIDLDSNEDNTLKLTFDLPLDTEDRDYDVFIKIKGELNNTIHKVEYTLDLVVEVDKEEGTSRRTTTLDELKTTIDEFVEKNYYDEYTASDGLLKTCEATIKTRDNTITTLNDYKSKSEICNNEKGVLNTQITTLQTYNKKLAINNTAMVGNITNVKNTRIYWIVGILILVGYLFYRYKEKLFPKSEIGKTETGR